jgi:phosphate transport system permease protein
MEMKNGYFPPSLILHLITLLIVTPVVLIFVLVLVRGLPALTPEFLLAMPRDGMRAGGIFPAIVGPCYLVGGAILIALPFGIGAAIYLTEYTREGRATQLIRTTVDLLNGTPSIVFGLFGLTFLVYFLNFGISLYSFRWQS